MFTIRLIVLVSCAATVIVTATVSTAQPSGAIADASGAGSLAEVEERLAQRYDRLEELAGRLAELSGAAQARRATLLRELVARGRQRDIAGKFERVVAALERESYSSALGTQDELQADLESLLKMLLEEDRDRQIESQRKRVARYLKEVGRLMRLQRGIKARNEGGDDTAELADDQGRAGTDAAKLIEQIVEQESDAKAKAQPGSESKGQPSGPDPSESDRPSSEQDDPAAPADGDSSAPPSNDDGEQKPSKGSKGQGRPMGQQPNQDSEQSDPQQETPLEEQQSPIERALNRLEQARQRMEQAKEALEKSKRRDAADEQQRAVEQLERAKAELERVLRQLREEEMERLLVMLEARFRKMLDAQIEVYDQTKQLDRGASSIAPHELEIASGRLSRKERAIVDEADRALLLLREDGTSVAFPEAVEQARDDMQAIADRLTKTKVNKVTQRLEEDVIEALEENLGALQQAIKNLRQQQGRPQQSPSSGQPGEKPLVDQLAELRMIRTLQMRVNRRTKDFGEMIEGEQAMDSELLQALSELALRQEKIFRATRDLHLESNQ